VAMISRLLKTQDLFGKRALQKRRYSARETYTFKEPTNRSHPTVYFWPCFLLSARLQLFSEFRAGARTRTPQKLRWTFPKAVQTTTAANIMQYSSRKIMDWLLANANNHSRKTKFHRKCLAFHFVLKAMGWLQLVGSLKL